MHKLAYLLTFILCLVLTSCESNKIVDTCEVIYINSTEPINLREQPSTKSKVLATHGRNSKIRSAEPYNEQWHWVVFANGDEGYMSSKYIEVKTETYTRTMTVEEVLLDKGQITAAKYINQLEKIGFNVTFFDWLVIAGLVLISVFIGYGCMQCNDFVSEYNMMKHAEPVLQLLLAAAGAVTVYLIYFHDLGTYKWLELGPEFILGLLAIPVVLAVLIGVFMIMETQFSNPSLKGSPSNLLGKKFPEFSMETGTIPFHSIVNFGLVGLLTVAIFLTPKAADTSIYLFIGFNAIMFAWYLIAAIIYKQPVKFLLTLLVFAAWLPVATYMMMMVTYIGAVVCTIIAFIICTVFGYSIVTSIISSPLYFGRIIEINGSNYLEKAITDVNGETVVIRRRSLFSSTGSTRNGDTYRKTSNGWEKEQK